MLTAQIEREQGERIVAAARAYTGVPFLHAGRNRAGLDCIGLPLVAVLDAGGHAPFPVNYAQQADLFDLLRPDWEALFRDVSNEESMPGDIAVFRSKLFPHHLAVLTDKGGMIHVYPSVRRVTSHTYTPRLLGPAESVWRFRHLLGTVPPEINTGGTA